MVEVPYVCGLYLRIAFAPTLVFFFSFLNYLGNLGLCYVNI